MSIATPVILLVLKNLELRQLYHEILINSGWEVVIADEAAKGLLELVSGEVNLIILDCKLPHGEDERFLKIVSHKPEWRHLPIVLLDYPDREADFKVDVENLNQVKMLTTHQTTPNQLVELVKNMLSTSSDFVRY